MRAQRRKHKRRIKAQTKKRTYIKFSLARELEFYNLKRIKTKQELIADIVMEQQLKEL